eukprot:3815908-Rhodomonas_salina.1
MELFRPISPWKIKPFTPLRPDLFLIVENETDVCYFSDDPSDIKLEIAEDFTRPGKLKPVLEGGESSWSTLKLIPKAIPSTLLLCLTFMSWIDAGVSVILNYVPSVWFAARAPRTPAFLSM